MTQNKSRNRLEKSQNPKIWCVRPHILLVYFFKLTTRFGSWFTKNFLGFRIFLEGPCPWPPLDPPQLRYCSKLMNDMISTEVKKGYKRADMKTKNSTSQKINASNCKEWQIKILRTEFLIFLTCRTPEMTTLWIRPWKIFLIMHFKNMIIFWKHHKWGKLAFTKTNMLS